MQNSNYVIWNKLNGRVKPINTEDFSNEDFDRLFRFYSEHSFFGIRRVLKRI